MKRNINLLKFIGKMFVILVYDVNVERTSKVIKVCRQYLTHIQNSVFEGEITLSDLNGLRIKINKIISDQDSVIIFQFRSEKYYQKEILGKEKNPRENIV